MWIRKLDDEIAYIFYPGFPNISPQLGFGIFLSASVFGHELSYINAVIKRAEENYEASYALFLEDK